MQFGVNKPAAPTDNVSTARNKQDDFWTYSFHPVAWFIGFARVRAKATENKPLMKKYFLHGNLVAKEGMTDKLTSILLDASKLISTVKGCVLYVIGRDPNDQHSVWVTEIWENKEDHDNSLKVVGVRELISQAIPLLDGQPQQGQELEIVGGKGSN